MPQPPSSIQPVFLHIAQPAPSHCQQLMSISALGSVYGKKLGRNRDARRRREHLAREREQRALQIGERHSFADDQPFDLREHRRVRQVEIVAAVDAARRDDPDRRLVRLHVADLHRRGVRAQQRPRDRRSPSPRIGVARYSVSCMSRAGCSAGMFSASKQCHSSSTSGPSTMAKPMRVKISSMRSRTTVSGWRWPRRGARPGSVTSTRAGGRARCCAASSYAVQRASIACFSALA